MDDATMNFGLLMESAQAHQKLAETHLEQLRAHTRGLDAVVRDEIRRTLIDELQMLSVESKRTAETLRRIGRGAVARVGLSSIVIAILCTCIPTAIMRWTLPSEAAIAALRVRRDTLAASAQACLRACPGRAIHGCLDPVPPRRRPHRNGLVHLLLYGRDHRLAGELQPWRQARKGNGDRQIWSDAP